MRGAKKSPIFLEMGPGFLFNLLLPLFFSQSDKEEEGMRLTHWSEFKSWTTIDKLA